MVEEPKIKQSARFGRNERRLIALAIGIATAVTGTLGAQAFADSKAYSHLKLIGSDAGEHGKWSHSSWRGGGRDHFAAMSEEEMETRIERMVKHLAIEIDATAEQQEKITALIALAAKDLRPVHAQMRQTGEDIRELLLVDTIDRDALEKVRAERLADAERISKNLIAAMADVAEILSPEQRWTLAERIEDFRSMRRGRG